MKSDVRSFVASLRGAETPGEVAEIKLKLIEYLHDLGLDYAQQLRDFSESVIRTKEEWYKKSMTECVHQAGREVGYAHEATKVEIDAVKILLTFISDTEKVIQDESEHPVAYPEETAPSSTSESDALPREE